MTDDDPRPDAPEQDQDLPASADAEATHETVATPDTDGARIAEAGNTYVGRGMDDRLKTNPRVRDGDDAVAETRGGAESEEPE